MREVEEDNRRNKINLKQALTPPGFDSAQPDSEGRNYEKVFCLYPKMF